MRISIRTFSVLASLLLICVYSQAATNQHTLTSPNGKLSAVVESGENLQWSLSYDGQQLIAPSAISMTLADGTVYGGAAKVSRETRRSVNRTIQAHIYKKSQVQDTYNELTLKFKNYSLILRAFDDGFAYRFVSHSKVPFKVVSEKATFALPEDWNMYFRFLPHETEQPPKGLPVVPPHGKVSIESQESPLMPMSPLGGTADMMSTPSIFQPHPLPLPAPIPR